MKARIPSALSWVEPTIPNAAVSKPNPAETGMSHAARRHAFPSAIAPLALFKHSEGEPRGTRDLAPPGAPPLSRPLPLAAGTVGWSALEDKLTRPPLPT